MEAPLIELIFFPGCPHVEDARTALRAGLWEAGVPPEWQEWDQSRPETPRRVLGYGSPTILIGGRDVMGESPANAGRACRADGIPTAMAIRIALADPSTEPH